MDSEKYLYQCVSTILRMRTKLNVVDILKMFSTFRQIVLQKNSQMQTGEQLDYAKRCAAVILADEVSHDTLVIMFMEFEKLIIE